jgi:hypothetical protein
MMGPVRFKNQAAQGDVYLLRVDKLPDGVKQDKIEDGRYVLGHSESGHCHVVEATDDVTFYYIDDPMIAYLEVKQPTILRHEKQAADMHEPIQIDPGIYEVRRQREYTPEGFRRVAD